MVNLKRYTASLAFSLLVGSAFAHPGEIQSAKEIKREVEKYAQAQQKAVRSMAKVQNTPHAVALKARAAERRAATVAALRAKRGITISE
jgi:hypothetical protein